MIVDLLLSLGWDCIQSYRQSLDATIHDTGSVWLGASSGS